MAVNVFNAFALPRTDEELARLSPELRCPACNRIIGGFADSAVSNYGTTDHSKPAQQIIWRLHPCNCKISLSSAQALIKEMHRRRNGHIPMNPLSTGAVGYAHLNQVVNPSKVAAAVPVAGNSHLGQAVDFSSMAALLDAFAKTGMSDLTLQNALANAITSLKPGSTTTPAELAGDLKQLIDPEKKPTLQTLPVEIPAGPPVDVPQKIPMSTLRGMAIIQTPAEKPTRLRLDMYNLPIDLKVGDVALDDAGKEIGRIAEICTNSHEPGKSFITIIPMDYQVELMGLPVTGPQASSGRLSRRTKFLNELKSGRQKVSKLKSRSA